MKNNHKQFVFKITRYDPDQKKFRTEEYSITAKKNITVLDALHLINREHHISLSYRFSCEMGICGSCGAVVNGNPVLTCSTFCRDLKQPIEISPLRNFPVVKDLVVDIDSAMSKFRKTLPYTDIVIKKSGQQIQSPSQLKKISQSSQCIKCFLCYAACPVYAKNREFIGPAAGALAFKYHKDNRDKLKSKRVKNLIGKNGVWNCTFIGECSNVCPKKVDPAKALQKMKANGMLQTVKLAFKKQK